MRILIAEDDPVTLESIDACLKGDGFTTVLAKNGKEALRLWEQREPDLVCLDIMMPEIDGYEVCRRIRAQNPRLPVLLLSAKSEEIDVVIGLELGADDFIRKPFGRHELLARVRTALRRTNGGARQSESFEMGSVKVFPKELRAKISGTNEVELTPREVAILSLLHTRKGEAVHRDEILDRCWGIDYFPESRTLDQHIAKLRKKIEKDPSNPAVIETVRGVGYRYR